MRAAYSLIQFVAVFSIGRWLPPASYASATSLETQSITLKWNPLTSVFDQGELHPTLFRFRVFSIWGNKTTIMWHIASIWIWILIVLSFSVSSQRCHSAIHTSQGSLCVWLDWGHQSQQSSRTSNYLPIFSSNSTNSDHLSGSGIIIFSVVFLKFHYQLFNIVIHKFSNNCFVHNLDETKYCFWCFCIGTIFNTLVLEHRNIWTFTFWNEFKQKRSK